MDYVKPADVAKSMVETGSKKLALPISSLLIRGIMSGAILGVATSLAFNGAFTTGQPLVGAIIFPVGLIMIVLLGLELVTGSFALVAAAPHQGRDNRRRRDCQLGVGFSRQSHRQHRLRRANCDRPY